VDGTAVTATTPGDWIAFKDADFGNGINSFTATVSNATEKPLNLEIRLDSPTGTLVGEVAVPVTGDVYVYTAVTTQIKEVAGIHDLYLVFNGPIRISTFNFHNQ
jgi:beta-glucosidase